MTFIRDNGETVPSGGHNTPETPGDSPKPNGLKRMWNRRFKSVMIWFSMCVGLLFGNRYCGLDKELVKLLIEKSAWGVGLLIIGLSGTDFVKDWIQKYK